ncbi:MAG: leucine--tRNA ligase [Bacillati bacterium ANGP1]|uniref:Leucine--tRNA ligase n=1 Tax=Candidatus Segetimicrobium genomatis TaxID=2569760 RepID=A0A537J0V3_9BACT|nr:MAG: leucine--tRNA ligase [Terrabacteria group bacterium ANGP1]
MGIRERGNATPRHGEQFRVPAIPRSRDPAKRGDAVGTRAARIRVHFDHGAVEAHWRRAWEERGVYRTPVPSGRPKAYVLDFFPYPSGDGLSVGHAKNYVPTDVLARYYRMRGHAVLHPMGWDAFGLPAENEALLRGRHPRDTTREYGANYRRQLQLIGCSYDWSREFTTSDPRFYRWTQWGFLLLLRRGLAYRATGWQWWCPKCRTILANEQVEDGRCWRHGDTPVERRALEQWYVRTTAYAERLLTDLAELDWPESIKTMQRGWIGRSEGAEVRFRITEGDPGAVGQDVAVFTTRVDTIFGATFLALAPEHPLATGIATPSRRAEVAAYLQSALRRPEVDRMNAEQVPSGVFTGAHAAHPFTGDRLPVYVADYVLAQYGRGAVMGVPAHDERDFRFATARHISIRRVVQGGTGEEGLPYGGEGVLRDSGQFSGLLTGAARAAIAEALRARDAGEPAVRFRMRDWLISRQRYWGAPIPVIHCDRCGIVPVPDADLPVLLPDVERYEPAGTGRSPLAGIESFVRTTCPRCGGGAARETDTLDGFADSNWYFLRFTEPSYPDGPWHPDAVRYWLPVDWYVGGAEHAVMHLLYARFFTKVLYDEGLVAFAEPFLRLRNQGSMLSPLDGTRMSKSRGNIVTPDEVVAAFGADALRVAVMFIGPFDQDVTWDPQVAAGAARFVRRLFALWVRAAEAGEDSPGTRPSPFLPDPLPARLHRLIRIVGESVERFRFNALIAELMTFLHDAERWEPTWAGTAPWHEAILTLIRICAPVVPFAADEAWARFGRTASVHQEAWPEYDPTLAADTENTVVVQVDGKMRDRFTVPTGIDPDALVEQARLRDRVVSATAGRLVVRVVVVPGKLVNFVTRKQGRPEEISPA